MTRNTIRFFAAPALAGGLLAAMAASSAVLPGQETYRTADDAVRALALAAAGDSKKADEVFGRSGRDLLRSGDDVADRADRLAVKKLIDEKVAFEDRGYNVRIAILGNAGWAFPVPLVFSEDRRWHFDVEAGREEVVTRRVGRNELETLQTMREYVKAQREYRRGKYAGAPAYAQRVVSNEGKRDGLYWPGAVGQPESPLGPLFAQAAAEGYSTSAPQPRAFHGYFFRPLKGQGKKAPGGEMSYVDDQGLMTRGFALLAWPAKYGVSGIMTFVVSRQGIVFQKDLGQDTATLAGAIQAYDPDETWNPTKD